MQLFEQIAVAGRSPAAGTPLREGWALGAERAVVAVARVEPRVVRQPVEELVLHVVDERGEVVLGAPGRADPARKE